MVSSASPALPGFQALELRARDGLPLAAQSVAGEGTGVLLAHGFGQTRQAWSATQARLAIAGFSSLAWDARGHGRAAQ